MKRIGLSLSLGKAWAVTLGAARADAWTAEWEVSEAGLRDLLARLKAHVGGAARLHVALLPGLSELRRLSLPPLKPGDLRDVVRRNLPRYFPRGDKPLAFGAQVVPGGVWVAVAPLDIVSALEQGTRAVAWRLESVSPAEIAWAQHGAASGATEMVVRLDDRVETLHFDRDGLTEIRRTPRRLAPPDANGLESPETVAAALAQKTAGPEIVSDGEWSRRSVAVRRGAGWLAAAAVLVVLLAGAVQWWGETRELAMLRGARAQHAPQVAQALASRQRADSLESRYAILSQGALTPGGSSGLDPALGKTLGSSLPWSGLLAEIAERLPRTAYLTAFQASGDSITLEGVAKDAGPVLEALRSAPHIAALRATAPIRREVRDSGRTVERFSLGARLASGGER
jgi:hypothetical protein